MDFRVRFLDRSVERFGSRQVVVFVVPMSDPCHRHFAGQLPGRMSTHAISDDEEMATSAPRFHVVGQHNRVRILVCGASHTDIAHDSMLQAIFPIHDSAHVVSALRVKIGHAGPLPQGRFRHKSIMFYKRL